MPGSILQSASGGLTRPSSPLSRRRLGKSGSLVGQLPRSSHQEQRPANGHHLPATQRHVRLSTYGHGSPVFPQVPVQDGDDDEIGGPDRKTGTQRVREKSESMNVFCGGGEDSDLLLWLQVPWCCCCLGECRLTRCYRYRFTAVGGCHSTVLPQQSLR